MASTLVGAAAGSVVFMVLDGIWLGLVMTNFYRDQLAPIARLSNGGFGSAVREQSAMPACSPRGVSW